jgi:hypothetical protein
MQASERYRLTKLYRNEIAGRLGLGVKCAACVSALSVLALVAGGAGDRGAAETPTHAVARPDDGNAYDKETVVDDRRVVSVAPMTAP